MISDLSQQEKISGVINFAIKLTNDTKSLFVIFL